MTLTTAADDVVATNLERLRSHVDDATPLDVERALRNPRRSLDDFAVLLSDAAGARLEDLARLAHEATIRRFGRTIRGAKLECLER